MSALPNFFATSEADVQIDRTDYWTTVIQLPLNYLVVFPQNSSGVAGVKFSSC
jgi:hypothetical protein